MGEGWIGEMGDWGMGDLEIGDLEMGEWGRRIHTGVQPIRYGLYAGISPYIYSDDNPNFLKGFPPAPGSSFSASSIPGLQSPGRG